MKLTVSAWHGPVAESGETVDPTVRDLTDALDRLDGAACGELSLGTDEPFAYVTVGGGGGPALFLATAETPEVEILRLTDPDAPDTRVSLVCGGQRADFSRRDLVDRQTALTVLTRFLEGQPYDRALPWSVE